MTAAIYGANTTYYSERDYAYMKRDAGDTKLWKEMLDKYGDDFLEVIEDYA